jgi:putative endonuclease
MLYRIADRIRRSLRHNLGKDGEDLAHRYLRRKKYLVVARNYRPASGAPGEIDLVAWDGPKLVFVEVKTRAGDRTGFPERAVDGVKRNLIIRTARDYVRRTNSSWENVRFDVISITGVRKPRIEHLVGAFAEPMTID